MSKALLFYALNILLASSKLCAFETDYNIASLNKFENRTNRNFKVTTGETPFFLRVGRYNPAEIGIDRRLEIDIYLIAEKLQITPKLLGYNIENGLLITEFINGSIPSIDEIHNCRMIEKVIYNLQALHRYPTDQCQYSIDTVFMRNQALQNALAKTEIPLSDRSNRWVEYRNTIENGYYQGVSMAICHGDLYRENIIESNDGRLLFVDWEYAFYGYVIDDIGKFCSSNWLNDQEIDFVVQHYWGKEDATLKLKLMQNIFMQQFNFYLWCLIQSKHDAVKRDLYLGIAEKVATDLDRLLLLR